MLPARRLSYLVLSLSILVPTIRALPSPETTVSADLRNLGAGFSVAGHVGAKNSHVSASLVAADGSVAPGHSVLVALRLVHEPHWHTYWVNPGTGLPTTLKWMLPPGWKAGPIQWPVPNVLRDTTGTIIGQGYEGDVLLPVLLEPPAKMESGTRVTLRARADWLMCQDVCVPGNASLSLTLPIASAQPQPDRKWGAKIRDAVAALPQSNPAWRITATRAGETVTLSAKPAGATEHRPEGFHFYSEDGLIAYDAPQSVEPLAGGGVVLTLHVSKDGPPKAKALAGVLVSDNGWRPDGTLHGLAVDAPLGAAAAPVATLNGPGPSRPFVGTLVLALLGGLILNLMPCVFPVLGIKIMGFVNQAGHERKRIAAHGLVFSFGVVLSFWILAGTLAVLRAGGDRLGWGYQLQSPEFVYGLTVLMLVFGMNLSGVFEFGLRATSVGSGLQSRTGYAGSFFGGVLATVVATPCSAPFLAPALGAALAVSTSRSFVIFTTIAIGLSLPYLVLSLFPQAVRLLPRPGAWMETFKKVMAFPLYGTAAYLVWVLAGQTGAEGFQAVLFSLVVIAFAIWLYGHLHAPGAGAGRARSGVAGLVILGGLGLWLGWPVSKGAATTGDAGVVWQPWSPEEVARLRGDGRIVYVDFTARWCATCQTNKRLVFHDRDVLNYFETHRIATLRADWTRQDPRITKTLAHYGRSAVPFDLIWVPGREQPIILPELLTGSIVLDTLRSALKR